MGGLVTRATDLALIDAERRYIAEMAYAEAYRHAANEAYIMEQLGLPVSQILNRTALDAKMKAQMDFDNVRITLHGGEE